MNKIALDDYKFKKRKLVVIVILASAIIGVFSALLTGSLKMLTEIYGHHFRHASFHNKWLTFILPLFGLTMIRILRKFIFRNKKNKGITEIFYNLGKKVPLPAYKIPSHYINGLSTVAFGGSTGIEVSTVVSTAAIGSVVSSEAGLKRKNIKTF